MYLRYDRCDSLSMREPLGWKGLSYEIYLHCPRQLMRRPLILRQRYSTIHLVILRGDSFGPRIPRV